MAGLPPKDQEVTQEELVRLVERLAVDRLRSDLSRRDREAGHPIGGRVRVLRVTVRYVQLVRPMK